MDPESLIQALSLPGLSCNRFDNVRQSSLAVVDTRFKFIFLSFS